MANVLNIRWSNQMNRTTQSAYFSQINVAPLTDVFLVLLVIMMLIIPLAEQTSLKVSAPSTVPGGETKTPDLTANIYQNGQIKLNGKLITPPDGKTVQSAIEKEQKRMGKKDLLLQIAAEEMATQQDVVSVMDAAVGAGIQQVAVTNPVKSIDK